MNIVALDVRDCCSFTSFFVLATGKNVVHLDALVQWVAQAFKKRKLPFTIEGSSASGWQLVDAGNAVFHFFLSEKRAFYHLERLWGDTERLEI